MSCARGALLFFLPAALSIHCGEGVVSSPPGIDQEPGADADGQDLSLPPFQQDSGPSGFVSMEAESFHQNVGPVGGHSWAKVSDSEASGGMALVAAPDSGTLVSTGYKNSSPRLDFNVSFVKTGTHYVWVRGHSQSNGPGSSDSCHVGLDGVETASADGLTGFSTSWSWSKQTMDASPATLTIGSAGPHTVNVWMREDGFVIDKIVLTTDSTFVPQGAGVDESPQPTAVASFTLVNADTGQDVGPLTEGATLNLATLPAHLNIRANTQPSTVGSVRFGYDANASFSLENYAPYELAGDPGVDYEAWTPAQGDHTVVATSFSGKNATGTAGTALTVHFRACPGPCAFKRQLFANDWGLLKDLAGAYLMVDNSVSMNIDSLVIGFDSDYFEAARALGTTQTYPPAPGDGTIIVNDDPRAKIPLLEGMIHYAHKQSMQLHARLPINYVNSSARGEHRRFGDQFRIIRRYSKAEYDTQMSNKSGSCYMLGYEYTKSAGGVTWYYCKDTCWGSPKCYRNDLAFKEIYDYELDLLEFVAKNYPELDGIHLEEPIYPYTESYSSAMRARFKTKYGYDPIDKTPTEVNALIDGLETDVLKSFFTDLRARINTSKANKKLLLSANALYYYSAHTGLDPVYLSKNNLLDWYAAQIYRGCTALDSTSNKTLCDTQYDDFVTATADKLVGVISKARTPSMPVASIAGIAYAKIGNQANVMFPKEIENVCTLGVGAEMVFAYNWAIDGGKTLLDGRTFDEYLNSKAPGSCPSITSP